MGVEACEDCQTFSPEVIDANEDVKCYGKSTVQGIYSWFKVMVSLERITVQEELAVL